jgi:hypothetical protein
MLKAPVLQKNQHGPDKQSAERARLAFRLLIVWIVEVVQERALPLNHLEHNEA